MNETCLTCRFHRLANPGYEWGLCRRHAPVEMQIEGGGSCTVWPSVSISDFCGDHEPVPVPKPPPGEEPPPDPQAEEEKP
jgi:hypothetical protein